MKTDVTQGQLKEADAAYRAAADEIHRKFAFAKCCQIKATPCSTPRLGEGRE